MLDRDVKEKVVAYEKAGFPPYNTMTPTELRLKFNESAAKARTLLAEISMADVREHLILDAEGRSIKLRIYYPTTEKLLPAQLYFHGGGFVIRDDMDVYDATCRLIAKETHTIVVAVDYRLAPEDPFPAAINDCLYAIEWVFKQAGMIGCSSDRIGVWGESCGGNLALVVSLLLSDQGKFNLSWAVSVSPMLDPSMSTVSYQQCSSGYFLTKDTMEWFWHHYLPTADCFKNPLVCPKYYHKVDGLPPTFIATTQYDPLRDEGKEYADLLKTRSVITTYYNFLGLTHGFFDMYHTVAKAKEACDELFEGLNYFIADMDS